MRVRFPPRAHTTSHIHLSMAETGSKYIPTIIVERERIPLPEPDTKSPYSNDGILMPTERAAYKHWLYEQILSHIRKYDFGSVNPSAKNGLVDDLEYWLKHATPEETIAFCQTMIALIDRIPPAYIHDRELYIPFCTLVYKTAKELQRI